MKEVAFLSGAVLEMNERRDTNNVALAANRWKTNIRELVRYVKAIGYW